MREKDPNLSLTHFGFGQSPFPVPGLFPHFTPPSSQNLHEHQHTNNIKTTKNNPFQLPSNKPSKTMHTKKTISPLAVILVSVEPLLIIIKNIIISLILMKKMFVPPSFLLSFSFFPPLFPLPFPPSSSPPPLPGFRWSWKQRAHLSPSLSP